MMETHLAIARQFFAEASVCVTCNKTPDRCRVSIDTYREGFNVEYLCHGARDVMFHQGKLPSDYDLSAAINRWAAATRVFLRSVATYGVVSPAARRERRERLRT